MSNLISEAYALFVRAVPLPFDCGELCGGACCKGDDSTGMRLLPGERELFESKAGFEIKKTEDGDDILICSGECKRHLRPYACRIFPLFPLVEENDGVISVQVIFDPRAKLICPIAEYDKAVEFRFVRAVRRSAKLLCKDSEIKQYLLSMSDYLRDMQDLSTKFLV